MGGLWVKLGDPLKGMIADKLKTTNSWVQMGLGHWPTRHKCSREVSLKPHDAWHRADEHPSAMLGDFTIWQARQVSFSTDHEKIEVAARWQGVFFVAMEKPYRWWFQWLTRGWVWVSSPCMAFSIFQSDFGGGTYSSSDSYGKIMKNHGNFDLSTARAVILGHKFLRPTWVVLVVAAVIAMAITMAMAMMMIMMTMMMMMMIMRMRMRT